MKITIIGGGFIGSTIADRLLKDVHELRIFERPRVEPLIASFRMTKRLSGLCAI